uniref:TAFII28-like protein domain-containing protein n=1 Tax=Palpitomonas bilix TaxID=652834 RepID=A0A7S3DIL2_9EUKA|mmetsp:Transcript_39429/g.101078  ORF Transcript_39429/g.101078 Transcript_39429/m.101078 type:complete len:181 (+) Transcript_39429:96-638(+)
MEGESEEKGATGTGEGGNEEKEVEIREVGEDEGEEGGEGGESEEKARGEKEDEPAKEDETPQVDEQNMKMMSDLMKSFTEEQYERYTAYRRGSLDKSGVTKLMEEMCGRKRKGCGYFDVLMAGSGKLFVGELVEKATLLREKEGVTGAILPHHYYQALRMMKNTGKRSRKNRGVSNPFRK